ncbi:MAG: AAA family ATPase [Burkholderiaceae bacterium]|jgi:general secretion pathway protein A|nr:AAA family ATPase [Burkholderiaceae bacterium]MDH5208148.1 AAA family ATPase [Burkholderiaceae bacterium]
MYERHFGLKQRPFSIAPDPRYLFMSERHREALAHLLYGVQGGGGFVLLTGDVGAGKTTVCRCFLGQLPERCNVAYIFNPKLTVEELLKTVCAEFRIPYRHEGPGVPTVKDYVDALNEFLLRTHAVRQNSVLIIDEAQNLSANVLEQLRLLTNLETNERKLLQIILIGQPELRAVLARRDMQQLAQRVVARYHLEALTEEETAHYVNHRLAVAGLHQANPFDRRAMRRIFRYSRGVPRRINLLCDRALLGAYASGKPMVDGRILDKAAEEVLDAADFGRIRRARYERVALVGIGLAVGATLVGAAGLLMQLGERGAPRAGLAADAGKAPATPVTAPTAAPASAPTPEVTGQAAAGPEPATPASFDLRRGYASLVGAEIEAWQELARVWAIAPGNGDPCAAAEKQKVRCYRTGNATLALIRQLDRPGVLTLRDAANRPAYVMISGLSNDSATLNIGGVDRTVPLVVLADYWRGEFATYWRPPPNYAGTIVDSRAGPAALWLARQLAMALGDTGPVGPRLDDATLKNWIHRFQLAQGLPSDGSAGPITLMQLNRANGVDEPRLQKAT